MKLGNLVVVIACAATVGGVAAGLIDAPQVSAVKKAILRDLSDPGSAQWRNVRWVKAAFTVCGEVNARNRAGGYVGFVPFFASVFDGVPISPQFARPMDEAVSDADRAMRRIVLDEHRSRCGPPS